MNIRAFPAAVLALSALAGCADTRSGYPSLAPRPIERAVLRAEAAPATAPVETPPLAATADVAQIVASAQAADAAFKAALDAARPQIEAGRAAAEGSEDWAAGQLAYSRAEAARAPVGQALAELDRRRQAAVAAGNTDEEAAIAEATLQVQALDEAERALLEAMMPS
jgi:hypothetical protein